MSEITWKERREKREPKPVATHTIRMEREFYKRIADAAHHQRVSANTFCLTAIERLLKEVEGKS